jgi:hypothetical protein
MRHNFGPIFGRIAAVVALLLALGIVFRLVAAILTPVLPGPVANALSAGWGLFYSVVQPAVPAAIAVGVLCAIGWVAIGSRR